MYPGYFTWLPYVQVIFAAVTLGLLWKNRTHMVGGALKVVVAFSAAIAMSLTPLAWSADAAKHPDSTNPTAGPATVQVGHHHPKTQHWSHILARVNSQHGQIITYLRANRHGAKYLLVTFGAQTAARYITATGDNILPVGGFDGGDPSPTLDQFKQMVRDGQIRYVMAFGAIDQVGPQGIDRSVGATIRSWVRHRCVKDLNAPRGSRLYVCSQ
jgi:4-amino-4-deoxy-L-arabinose transferase-like glycosyltransferase